MTPFKLTFDKADEFNCDFLQGKEACDRFVSVVGASSAHKLEGSYSCIRASTSNSAVCAAGE
jgi:hypothetical protein